jgi:malonate transporter MadL subunit
MPQTTEMGVGFWGAMYIPVVVAMAATQNVIAALRGGPVALLAAFGSVLVCAVFVSLINRTERPAPALEAEAEAEAKERIAPRHA